ncbi:MAG: formylglycine-generating enzyme family protein, partial [Bacteroidota bacterium]
VHPVTLSDYYIGETEVTQAQWKAVMGDNPSGFNGCDDCPVENVSWNDAQKFITRLNARAGSPRYRLPTEAEWEYAARGGANSRSYQYAGSNDINEVAWYDVNSRFKTHPVKGKKPNELGVYDMSGNVYEWCSDWYGYYLAASQTNPQGPSAGVFRVFRGGGWFDAAGYCRASFRNDDGPGGRGIYLGFRLAAAAPR